MKRNIGPILLLLAGVGLFGGFAWLTRHPESPWLEQAQDWPFVGELARRFRDAYLHPEPRDGAATPEPVTETPPPRVAKRRPPVAAPPPSPVRADDRPGATPAGEPAGSEAEPIATLADQTAPSPPPPAAQPSPSAAVAPEIHYVALDWVWFLPGNRIVAEARAEAEVQAELEALAYLPVLDRDGPWAQVMYHDRRGWIDTSWEPGFNRKKARRGILRHRYEPVLKSDLSRLWTAKKMLGVKKSEVKVGAYTLFTDVDDPELLTFLDGAAIAAENAYFARYARLPSGDPYRSAVLFAKEADYRQYYEKEREEASSNLGHAERGILSFFAEGRSRVDLARTLVHEIGHLLNDRSLAWSLPTWLEEGIATDLGSVWVESSPDVAADLLSGGEGALAVQGIEARLLLLEGLLERGKLPSLATVLSLDYETFHSPDLEPYAYAHSAAFIRYLLDGEEGRLADGFRAFLKRVADGLTANLLKFLDRDVEELDRGFQEWLRSEAQASRERLQTEAQKLWRRR